MTWILYGLWFLSHRWLQRKAGEFPLELMTPDFFLHACRSPLTDILLNTERLLQQLAKTSPHSLEKQTLEQIYCSAGYLATLTQTWQKPSNQPFSPIPALHEVLQRHSGQAQIYSLICLPPGLRLRGNQFYFQEILHCLIQNSREAQPDQARPVISVTTQLVTQTVEIRISDGGPGMNRWQQWRAFQWGTSRKVKHTGLGLPLVKKMMEKHFSGRLDCFSYPGIGTIMTLRLPTLPIDNQTREQF